MRCDQAFCQLSRCSRDMQLGPSNTSRICRPEATNSQETARMRHLRSFWFFAEPATQALLSRSEAFSSEVTTGLLADQDGPKSQLSSGSSTCGLVASASAAEGTSRRPRERSSARQLDGVEAGLHSLLISTGRSQLLRHDSACKAVSLTAASGFRSFRTRPYASFEKRQGANSQI